MGGLPHRDRGTGVAFDRAHGASLVEFALIAPFLILLLLGSLDASSLLFQNLDVRHAAREGGRLAAISQGDLSTIGARVCGSMDDDSATTVSLAGSGGSLGDEITATVTKQAEIITGFTSWAFNPPVPLAFIATFRIEALPVLWTDGTYSC